MATPVRTNSYRWLSQYYDELFEPFRSPIDAARQHVLGRILRRVTIVCDLACGTGTTALSMARQRREVFALDLSPTMCRLARRKARLASVPLHVLCADMREFRLPRPVDLITCEYDALNHVPKKTDLLRVARAAARALKPAGYFFFDVNNRKGFKQYWSRTYWIEGRGVIAVMKNGQDSLRDRAWCDIEWFIGEGDLWRRHQERVEEVCWSSAEIRQTLSVVGFDQVRAWDATPFFKNNPLIRPGCRTVYLARKACA